MLGAQEKIPAAVEAGIHPKAVCYTVQSDFTRSLTSSQYRDRTKREKSMVLGHLKEREDFSIVGMKGMKHVISALMGRNWKIRIAQAQKKCMKREKTRIRCMRISRASLF